MADIIAVVVLVILIGSAVMYIVKEKKKGTKCIGCPACGSCPGSKKTAEKKCAHCGDTAGINGQDE